MGASPSQSTINKRLAYLKKKNPGVQYRVIRASNGEVAIITEEWYKSCTKGGQK